MSSSREAAATLGARFASVGQGLGNIVSALANTRQSSFFVRHPLACGVSVYFNFQQRLAMRSILKIGIACAVLAMVIGCGANKSAVSQGAKTPEDAAAQVDAALQVASHNLRDEALAIACRDAAKVGAKDAVLKGIPAIVSHNLRDEVAEDCAIALRDSKQAAAAIVTANLIVSHNKRDEVLKKLASGE